MKILIALGVGAMLFAGSGKAQVLDGTPGVPCVFYARTSYGWDAGGTPGPGGGNISLQVAGLNGWATSQSAITDGGGSTPETLAKLVPGKVYNFAFTQTFDNPDYLGQTSLFFAAPQGYTIYINNSFTTPGNEISIPIQNQSPIQESISICLIGPGQLQGKAGSCSSILSGQIYWQVSLGHLNNGQSAGSLAIIDQGTTVPWTGGWVYTPGDLQYVSPSQEVQVVTSTNASYTAISQILGPEADVNIVTLSSTSYQIQFYNPSQLSGQTFSGVPFVVYTVQQGNGPNVLEITCSRYAASSLQSGSLSTATPVYTSSTTLTLNPTGGTGAYPYLWTLEDWSSGGPVRQEIRTWGGSVGSRTETRIVEPYGSTTPTTSVTNSFSTFPWGEELIGHTNGPSSDSTAVTTNYAYYQNAAETADYGLLESSAVTGGAWTAYDYLDCAQTAQVGCVDHSYRPFVNSPSSPSETASSGDVAAYTYGADALGIATRPETVQEQINGTSIKSAAFSYNSTYAQQTYSDPYPVDGSYPQNTISVVDAQRTDTTDASGDTMVSHSRYYREDATDDFYLLQPYSTVLASGAQESYFYERGTFNPSTSTFTPNTSGMSDPGLDSCIGVVTGSSTSSSSTTKISSYGTAAAPLDSIYLVPGKSTLQLTYRSHGQIYRSESYAWIQGAWVSTGWTNYSYDAAGFPAAKASSNGAVHSWAYTGDQLISETDESGASVSYFYDAAGRTSQATTTVGVSQGHEATQETTYTYDAENRITGKTVTSPNNTSDSLATALSYDVEGRLSAETSPGLSQVTYGYTSTGLNKTATYSGDGGATKVETLNQDGRLASVTGSAIYAKSYSYSVNGGIETSVTYGNTQNGTSQRYENIMTDWMSRIVEDDQPGFTGQSDMVENYSYNSGGQLTQVTRTGYAPTEFQYDVLGNLTYSGLNLGGNLAPNSTDRVKYTNVYFTTDSTGSSWLEKDTTVYPIANSSTAYTISTRKQRLSGFASGQMIDVISTDAYNNQTEQSVTVNTTAQQITITTTLPTAFQNQRTETIQNGNSVAVTDVDGLSYSASYDGLNRRISSTDARGNVTTLTYYAGSTLLKTVADPVATLEAYAYDGMGRVTNVETSGSTTYNYNAMGQLLSIGGTGSYPVTYSYDPLYGDQTGMTTYRAGSGGAGDQTTWTYDGPSGLLTKKTDPSGVTVGYSYTGQGQEYKRTNGRGFITTYGYDPNTGELTSVGYNDGTPALTYTYTRLGQLSTVGDYTGTRTFNYDTTNYVQLDSIQLGSFYNGLTLTRQYDSGLPGRPTGFKLGTSSSPAADLTQTYSYNNLGQFSTLTSASRNGENPITYSYGYLTNSDLVSGYSVTGSPFQVTKSYDPLRPLVTEVKSAWTGTSAATIEQYDYVYNGLHQRQSEQKSGQVFQDMFSGASYSSVYSYYTYDSLGQLASADAYTGTAPASGSAPSGSEIPGRYYGYQYDSVGNRVQAGPFSVSQSADDSYTTNSLDQYSQKDQTTERIVGDAQQGATVSSSAAVLNMVDRNYGGLAVVPTNTSPQAGTITVTATLSNSTYNATSAYCLPPQPQQIQYDADGNLSEDGVWQYSYDAENRLIEMLNVSQQVGGTPYKIEFYYDYLGRRVEKQVTSAQNQSPASRLYVYDGWNLIAETDTSWNPLMTYTWGLDGAGRLSAIGGAGALLQVTTYSGGNPLTDYFAMSDGNGNVTGLVNGSNGTTFTSSLEVAADYEYSPFGELMRDEVFDNGISGNPFRYSSKYTDTETGLVNFGLRMYSAAQGRFISRDPIGEAGGANLYAYCGNDGVNGVDVLGCDPGDNSSEDDPIVLPPFVVTPSSNDPWDTTVSGNDYQGSGAVVLPELPSLPPIPTQAPPIGSFLARHNFIVIRGLGFIAMTGYGAVQLADIEAQAATSNATSAALSYANAEVLNSINSTISGAASQTNSDPMPEQDHSFWGGVQNGFKDAFTPDNLARTIVFTIGAVALPEVFIPILAIGGIGGAVEGLSAWSEHGFRYDPNVAGQLLGNVAGSALVSAGVGFGTNAVASVFRTAENVAANTGGQVSTAASKAAEEGGALQSQVQQQQMSGSASNADIADAIANGHAFDKHVIDEGMYGDISQSEFADHIQAVLDNPTMSQSLSAGRSAFYDEASGTVVIVNPAAADYGTAFVPKNPLQYFQGLK